MRWSKIKEWLNKNFNTIAIIVGVGLGLIAGFALKSMFTIGPLALTYIGLPGKLIIRAFTMLMVPLIIASLSTSITATKKGENKKVIAMTFILITIFSTSASIFGIVLTTMIRPGVGNDAEVSQSQDQHSADIKQMIASQEEAIYDVMMNLVPDNVIGTTFMSHYTALVPNNPQNLSAGYKKVAERAFKTNMLGLCAFSLILGFAILHLGEKANAIKELLDETNHLIMTLLFALIKVMPVGMFSWMCVEAIKMRSPEKVIVQLGWFFASAFLAFGTIWFLLFPGIYFLVLRKNPFKMYYNIIEALIVGFGACSSAIALPVTMNCMEMKNQLSVPISHFVLPLGMTMHMPGAALYYPMVAIFVAQMTGTGVTFTSLIPLCIFTVMLSMAFPAAPAGGSNIVQFVTTCAIVGVDNPLAVLAYIMTVDWFMERMRTMTNIIGDCVIASIVQKYCHLENNNFMDDDKTISRL